MTISAQPSLAAVQRVIGAPMLPLAKLPNALRRVLKAHIAPHEASGPAKFVAIVPCHTSTTLEFTNIFLAARPTWYFIVSPQAHLTVIEHIKHAHNQTGHSSTIFLCQKGGRIDYFGGSQRNQSYDSNVTALVDTHGSASLNWCGRMNHRHEIHLAIRHIGWNTTGDINAVLDVRQQSSVAMRLINDHQRQRGRGAIHWAGLGRDRATAEVDGWIRIGSKGRGTDSVLFQNALLLSEQTRIKTKPNLEILNHDVKAFHGATVGRLSELEKFYLTARGLTNQQAEAMLINAFIRRVSQQAPSTIIKRQFDRYFNI